MRLENPCQRQAGAECRLSFPNRKRSAYERMLRILHRQMLIVSLVIQATGSLSLATRQDWPQWRGPNRDGVAERTNLPDRLPENLQSVWKVEVGEGYSTPVAVERKVVLFVRQQEKDTGELVWEVTENGPSYASPIAVDLAGHRQVQFKGDSEIL